MKNLEIVKIFREISYLLQMVEDDPNTIYKARAYEKAADVIENLSIGLEETYLKNGIEALNKISSIGSAISLKIEEFVNLLIQVKLIIMTN
ncbi:MAG: hypothetical protein E6L01_05145 [Thaumarchaeota archaeon]|nr:MAG: hypothetical protein E6L01_05145 [Nitrososphaerota archaeon]